MNFIEHMKLYRPIQTIHGTDYASYKHLNIKGGGTLSVQASTMHYCTPRKTLSDLSEYYAMEFAVVDKQDNFTTITDLCPDFERLTEIEEYYNGAVYGFVPVDLIEDLFNAIVEVEVDD